MSNKIDVLGLGFVELRSFMGSDQAIVDSARVSIAGQDVKPTSSNKGLIRYLMRHKHTTPFENVTVTFALKVPIFIARQIHRHRTFSYNEMSARYGVLPEEFYVPPPERCNKQSTNNHQGSAEELVADPTWASATIQEAAKLSFETYKGLLDHGLSRELARLVLPVTTYTMFYMTGNLWNFMHFMKLRLAKDHAQKEVVEYAQAMYDLLEPLVPEALAAFDDYHRNSVTFSAKEHTMLLRAMKNQGKFDPEDVTRFLGTEREADEFLRKIGER